MTSKLTLDKTGRVMIPKLLRQELHLGPGDTLRLDSKGEQIILRPLRLKAFLKKEKGVWVYQGGPAVTSVTALIDREREKRLRELVARPRSQPPPSRCRQLRRNPPALYTHWPKCVQA
jgi:AbrB family looped-hinge helix DNA binding protein